MNLRATPISPNYVGARGVPESFRHHRHGNQCQHHHAAYSSGASALRKKDSEHLPRKRYAHRYPAPYCSVPYLSLFSIADVKRSSSSLTSVFSLASQNFPPLSLHRCSRGGRMAKLTFSGNGLSTKLASGIWRMSFGWVMPPFCFPWAGCSGFVSTSLLSVSAWDYQLPPCLLRS